MPGNARDGDAHPCAMRYHLHIPLRAGCLLGPPPHAPNSWVSVPSNLPTDGRFPLANRQEGSAAPIPLRRPTGSPHPPTHPSIRVAMGSHPRSSLHRSPSFECATLSRNTRETDFPFSFLWICAPTELEALVCFAPITLNTLSVSRSQCHRLPARSPPVAQQTAPPRNLSGHVNGSRNSCPT